MLQEMKDKGECPAFMTEAGLTTLQKGYLRLGETPRDMYTRLAKTASFWLKDPTLESRFFKILWDGDLCPATPVASFFGTDAGLPISCNSVDVGDSLLDIFNKIKETAILTKYGAGVGVHLGRLRSKGDIIGSDGGKSDGVVPFSKMFDSVIYGVAQSGVRRGSAALYLPVDHKDYSQFLGIRKPIGDSNTRCLNIHQGTTIKDYWMEEMISGDKSKRETWRKIIETRSQTGETYLSFLDTINNNNPQMYKDQGFQVVTSNLCVAPETLVLTDRGHIQISSIVNQKVNVWNGHEWSEVTIRKTGENQKLVKVITDCGSSISCTPYHKFYLKGKDNLSSSGYDIKEAQHLIQGDLLLDYISPHQGGVISKTIKEVVDSGRISDTYCFTEPKRNMGVFNGILTGNCNEITLYTDEKHTFTCCLSSLNLMNWDRIKNSDTIELSIMFLDAVLSEYIHKASKIEGLENAVRSAEKSRALGLGVLGWHSLLQSRMIPFESFDAMMLNRDIFKTIADRTRKASEMLAQKYGEPEWCKGYGVRHTHRTAIAPTRSNSVISGGFSMGIEPIHFNLMVNKTAKGVFIEKNEIFFKHLSDHYPSVNQNDVIEELIKTSGSVQGLKFLSKKEKDVFLTAREINQLSIVQQAGQRQRYVDQGQSVNLFFTSKSNPSYINKVHLEAWKQGLKGLYYMRSTSATKHDSDQDYKECKSCEG